MAAGQPTDPFEILHDERSICAKFVPFCRQKLRAGLDAQSNLRRIPPAAHATVKRLRLTQQERLLRIWPEVPKSEQSWRPTHAGQIKSFGCRVSRNASNADFGQDQIGEKEKRVRGRIVGDGAHNLFHT